MFEEVFDGSISVTDEATNSVIEITFYDKTDDEINEAIIALQSTYIFCKVDWIIL